MYFTTHKIKDITFIDNDNKKTTLPGWAFIDVSGHTILQIYGQKKLNIIKEYLNEIH